MLTWQSVVYPSLELGQMAHFVGGKRRLNGGPEASGTKPRKLEVWSRCSQPRISVHNTFIEVEDGELDGDEPEWCRNKSV